MQKKISIIIFLSFLFPNFVFSSECSSHGYTIVYINGMNTSKRKAETDLSVLVDKIRLDYYKNESLNYEYLHNFPHIAGLGEFGDVVTQKIHEYDLDFPDYDLIEKWKSASEKVNTQKVLLVGHSQGNFYANRLYDIFQLNGLPRSSLGVYSVASPASFVSGNGLYTTSDTDGVINFLRRPILNLTILPANVKIKLAGEDTLTNGHSFSDIYLKYQSDKIISEIEYSLSKLKEGEKVNGPCIIPPQIDLTHKVIGKVFAVADPAAVAIKTTATTTYNLAHAFGSGVLGAASNFASAIGNIGNKFGASVITAVDGSEGSQALGDALSTGPIITTWEEMEGKFGAEDAINVPEETKEALPADGEQGGEPDAPVENPEPAEPPKEAAPALPEEKPEEISNTAEQEDTPAAEPPRSSGYNVILNNTPSDTTPPVITLTGNNPENVAKNFAYTDAGATALDDVDGEISVAMSGSVDTTVVGSYTLTYTATDAASNAATATRTVNVTDGTGPVITITGDNPMNILEGGTYTEPGATALDDVDGNISVVVTGAVNTSLVGVYTITYTATDAAGNTATATRTVNVNYDSAGLASSDLNENGIEDRDEAEVSVTANKTLAAGEYAFFNLTITNNAVFTLEGDPDSLNSFKGVKIRAVNLTVHSGASISADQKGYAQSQGPGASSTSTVGASYGGVSYSGSASSTYGSAKAPLDLGSAGAQPHKGGGAIRLVVSNTFTNDGIVTADGSESSSGGSIYVTSGVLAGGGAFHANGGNLFSTGFFKSPGGGGRVAVYYDSSTFSGTILAEGGCGSYDGFTSSCGTDGTIGIFNQTDNDADLRGSWKFLQADAPFSYSDILISNGANAASEDRVTVTADSMTLSGGSAFTLADGQVLNISAITLDGGSTMTLSGTETINSNTLTISGNSTLGVLSLKTLALTIPNLTIDSGSTITADRKGYGFSSGSGNGPGAPPSTYDPANPGPYYMGASYGGIGYTSNSSLLYGSETAPVDFGSAGNVTTSAARGGGAIKLTISGTLTNNGTVSAGGGPTGSGGSVYVMAGNLSGSGTFSANGGKSYSSSVVHGAGGGGRVALHFTTSSFTGAYTAIGWPGNTGGPNGAGAALLIVDSVPEPDTTAPSISSYTYNGLSGNLSVDPLITPVTIAISSSENVDWVSVKIENEADSSKYKIFFSGNGCVDDTSTCEKTWDGVLSSGGLLQDGTFRVKVHIKDAAQNEFFDYLANKIIVDTPE